MVLRHFKFIKTQRQKYTNINFLCDYFNLIYPTKVNINKKKL